MNVSIPENLREFVEVQVESGGYGSASEYVRELLRRERNRAQKEEELRRLLHVGVEEIKSGRFREFDEESLPELFGEIRKTVKKRISKKRAKK